MAVNKVIYGGNTLVDLTGDTVTAADLADGVKATGADGNPVIGLMQKVTIDAELSSTSTNPVQNKVIKAALDGKLGKTETAAAAIKDGAGNVIADIYPTKSAVLAVLSTKLGFNDIAYGATRDGAGNNIVDTYAKKTDISTGLAQAETRISALENSKVDKEGAAWVVESYRNGTEWYRVWSDGWVEQGGHKKGTDANNTITLLKPFANENYTVLIGSKINEAWYACSVYDCAATSMKFSYYAANYTADWYACGQGA